MGNLFCPYQEAKFRPEAVVLFFSEQRDVSEKIKLCKLMGAEIGAQRAIFFARASALVPCGSAALTSCMLSTYCSLKEKQETTRSRGKD